jgi:hypothetical protein
MTSSDLVLAATDDGLRDLLYVVVVLFLAAGGWIAGKIKESQERKEQERRGRYRIPPPTPEQREGAGLPPRRAPRVPGVPHVPPRPQPPREPDVIVVEDVPARRVPRRARPMPPQRPGQPVRARRPGVVQPPRGRAEVVPSSTQLAEQIAAQTRARAAEMMRQEQAMMPDVLGEPPRSEQRRRYKLSRAKLREAVVLSEIWSKPIALRDNWPAAF